MNGMEIFNIDDLSDDFMEIDDNQLLGAPEVIEGTVKKPKVDDKPDEDDGKDKDEVDTDDELQDVIDTPSEGSDEDINSYSSTLSPKFYSSLVQALKEGGILEDIKDDDIKSQDDFFTVLNESIKQREFADLNDDQKEYLEALRAGIPHEEIVEHQQSIQSYNEVTDDDIEDEGDEGINLRRNIIMTNFVAKGISEAKAKKLTDKIFESGDDLVEAKDAIQELKEGEKKAFELEKAKRIELKKAQEKAEKEARQNLDKIVKETKEIIPGLTIPVNIKNQIVKGLTQPVAYTEDKRPLDIISKYLYDNPIEGRFKLAYLLAVTDNMKKMSVLENKKAKRDVFKGLEEALKFREDGGVDNDSFDNGGKFNFDKFDFA